MINFTNIPQTITAAIGAIALSTAFVAAASGPIQTAQPTVSAAQSQA